MKYTYPDLGERDVLISYFPIQGANGFDRVACVVHDITDRKQLETVLTGMSRKLIAAHEQERTRIARELHDDINQRLALLAIELEQVRQAPSGLSPKLRARLHELQQHTVEISSDLHNMAYELHFSKLEYLGIVAAMRSFCRDFAEREKVEVDFVNDDIPKTVSNDVSLCLFRILQEALHNAVQHSRVRRFAVKLGCASNQLHLSVIDHGVGFELEAAMVKGGLGLISMRERVRLVNGTLAVESKPMKGTTIRVCAPLRLERSSEQAATG